MKVRTKLRLLIALYTLIPLLAVGLISAQCPLFLDTDFQEALTLGAAAAVLLVLFGPFFGGYWLLTRQLGQLKRFCIRIRNGDYAHVDLPNAPPDPEDENEIISLMRDMNWMANQIRIREDQLKEAVADLARSNAQLAQANARIEEARKALWGEMALAKKIQTALLPAHPRLPGFEIAASLAPTEMVGGDYYDVIAGDNCHWLIIGDVSGHGVPAGLIMMMAQTAVHTALHESPNISPRQLLSRINQTLTQNIRQLKESKYMTMTVVKLKPDGRFSFAGLHQDILIYRAGTREVEALETHGAWLGLMADIAAVQPEDSGWLEPADCLLLFTDGLTEARDEKGRMFGDEQLAAILAAHGEESAEQIHAALVQQVEPYRKTDDLTVLIAKYQGDVHASVFRDRTPYSTVLGDHP